ncbi:MAG: molybdenum cofactor guanylyltransferase [Firmicutes bacterium]|nr:molybdenum cofactor guanylyltransferase [Bacillota bacterium]
MKLSQKGAIVLAGGASSRMGQPKTLLKLGGVTLVERVVRLLQPHFHHVTLVTNDDHVFGHLPVAIVRDRLTGGAKNPLRGIHAGLMATGLPYQFVVACDMPFLNLDFINFMGRYAADYDVVVPRTDSYYQPLHAYYSRSCLKVMERQILSRNFKVTGFYDRLNVKTIGLKEIRRFDPHQDSFFNINTWDDYKHAGKKLAALTLDPAKDIKG